MNTIKWDDIKHEFFDDPEFKKEYDALETKYSGNNIKLPATSEMSVVYAEFSEMITDPDHIADCIELNEPDQSKVNKTLAMLQRIRQKEQCDLCEYEISDNEWLELWKD